MTIYPKYSWTYFIPGKEISLPHRRFLFRFSHTLSSPYGAQYTVYKCVCILVRILVLPNYGSVFFLAFALGLSSVVLMCSIVVCEKNWPFVLSTLTWISDVKLSIFFFRPKPFSFTLCVCILTILVNFARFYGFKSKCSQAENSTTLNYPASRCLIKNIQIMVLIELLSRPLL